MADWKTLSSRTVHETAWFKVTEDKVLNHKGSELTYTYLEKNPSVGIVVVNDSGDILIQRQFSYPIKKTHTVIPAGFCDGDEPLVAAKRELFEETGLESNEWHSLGMTYSSAGLSNNPCYGYWVRVNQPEVDQKDDEDISNQRFVPENEVRKMLQSFEIDDGFSLVPLYRYLNREKV